MNEREKEIYKKVNSEKRPYSDDEIKYIEEESEDKHSARYRSRIGDTKKIKLSFFKRYRMRLMDKLIYPIDICPFCESEETFHNRHCKKNIAGTCWDSRYIDDERGMRTLLKFDYCLSCQREFLIESYAWKKD